MKELFKLVTQAANIKLFKIKVDTLFAKREKIANKMSNREIKPSQWSNKYVKAQARH